MKEKREPLVSIARAQRLKNFAYELTRLCEKYRVDIRTSPDAEDFIEVIERDFKYPEGYGYSAHFQGVDSKGVWQTHNPKNRVVRCLVIATLLPEDR